MTPTVEQQSLLQEPMSQEQASTQLLPEQSSLDFIETETPSLEPGLSLASPGSWSLSATKRSFDLALALCVLTVSLLPGILIYFLVRLSSSGPGFFKQTRVGFEGRMFTIYKFRTMRVRSAGTNQPGLTRDGDHRITVIGSLLRKLKLDELPQFYNVLRGDMSVVGPRPKLRQYVSHTDLLYRPGITGPATLFFRDEERLLAGVPADDLDSYYDVHIKPLKARIDIEYMERATFTSDLRMIFATVFPALRPTIGIAEQSKSAIILKNRDGAQSRAVEASEPGRADDFAMIDSM